MNQRISVGAIVAVISLLSNLGAGLINGSYKTGTQVAKIESKLEYLSLELKRRDDFLNYRIDQLKVENNKKGG
jgi:hypothetical protein